MIVLKFGGSSLQSADMINRVLDILEPYLDNSPVAVLSAMGKTTDTLQQIAAEASDRKKSMRRLAALQTMHRETAEKLGIATCPAIPTLLDELTTLVTGLTIVKEISSSMLDALFSFGELLSTRMLTETALRRGWDAEWYDSRKLIITNSNFNKAEPDLPQSYNIIRSSLIPKKNSLAVVQGFIASDTQGKTTTLGRGGSDFSAAIIAAALKAEVLEIWTDAAGIMTADPRVVTDARTIPHMHYDDAAELAAFGAKVVHPATILPAVAVNLPVRIQNTYYPEQEGSVINNTPSQSGSLIAIASKQNLFLLQISTTRMLNSYNFLSSMFSIFTQWQCVVDLVTTSEVSVTVSLDTAPKKGMLHSLKTLGTVNIAKDMAVICLVGHEIWHNLLFCQRVFAAIPTEIPLHLISLGASRNNLSIVVPMQHMEQAVQALHVEFFPNSA